MSYEQPANKSACFISKIITLCSSCILNYLCGKYNLYPTVSLKEITLNKYVSLELINYYK
jgi:hypothetical protein